MHCLILSSAEPYQLAACWWHQCRPVHLSVGFLLCWACQVPCHSRPSTQPRVASCSLLLGWGFSSRRRIVAFLSGTGIALQSHPCRMRGDLGKLMCLECTCWQPCYVKVERGSRAVAAEQVCFLTSTGALQYATIGHAIYSIQAIPDFS